MSLDRLLEKIAEMQNPTVAGLDPFLPKLPPFLLERTYAERGETLEAAADAVFAFNRAIINVLADIVPAVKPQCACYEQLGWPGVRALEHTVRYARQKGLFVILDGKRNDIGSTMEAYSAGLLGTIKLNGTELTPFGADALTVNGYLGTDGIAPLLKTCEELDTGIFVLVKTSNPSSGELQDRLIDGKPVYQVVGDLCERWGESCPGKYGYSGVGAVVGATYPHELAALRKALPHTLFLVPGYGAQGGGAKGVAGAFDPDGCGAVVNSSRAILYAWQKECCPAEQFAEAARCEALRMRDDLRVAIGNFGLPGAR